MDPVHTLYGPRSHSAGLGRIVALSIAHPLHTRLTKMIGTSVSEATMRPDPRSNAMALWAAERPMDVGARMAEQAPLAIYGR